MRILAFELGRRSQRLLVSTTRGETTQGRRGEPRGLLSGRSFFPPKETR